MFRNRKWSVRRLFLFIPLIVFIYILYYLKITSPYKPFIPYARLRRNATVSFEKITIAHYTTTYGLRIDSKSKIFNENLQKICEIIDPEDYPSAHGVVVSIVDFARFPNIYSQRESYRNKHQSQLWVFHSEESPRNSYRSVQMKDITELDDWFNLTATLKPESDIHIQYKGYRIKPEIGHLLAIQFNQTSSSKSDVFQNTSSVYLNTLAMILNKEFNQRRDGYVKTCPYTCNQPLSAELLPFVESRLKSFVPRSLNRELVYIAWFVSNCDSHSGREEYVLKLRSQPGIHVDIYGDCSSIFHSHIIPLQCRKGTPNCMEKTLSNYRFYLSFENSKCDTYITEKYWMQGLNRNAVPIVMGAKREHYQRIAVPKSYIHVDDYPTIEQLAGELRRLNRNDSEYAKYLQWTQIYDVGGEYAPGSGIYPPLCFLGHYQRVHAMKKNTKQRNYLLERIRDIVDFGNVRLPNFNWRTATTKLVKISEFYNPKVNCWDNEFPSFPRRAWNFLFTWWKFF